MFKWNFGFAKIQTLWAAQILWVITGLCIDCTIGVALEHHIQQHLAISQLMIFLNISNLSKWSLLEIVCLNKIICV